MPGSPFDTAAAPHLHSVAVADFDGDGFADIASDSSDSDGDDKTDVAAIVSAGIIMWTQNQNGFDIIASTPVSFENATELAVGDIDGDGRGEIIAGCWNEPEIMIFDGAAVNTGD